MTDKIRLIVDVCKKLSDSQFIFWRGFEEEDAKYILSQNDTDKFLSEWYENTEYQYLDEAVRGISDHALIKTNINLWEESLKAFNNELYNLVICGLFPIADQMYSEMPGSKPNDTGYITDPNQILDIDKKTFDTQAKQKDFLVEQYYENIFKGTKKLTKREKLIKIAQRLKNTGEFPNCVDITNSTEQELTEEIWHQLFHYPQGFVNSTAKRAEEIIIQLGESQNDYKKDLLVDYNYLYFTYKPSIAIFFENKSFCDFEPLKLNRHWVLHGRSKRIASKLDCIKVINLIYSICLIYDYNYET